jgi:hypothetical protein
MQMTLSLASMPRGNAKKEIVKPCYCHPERLNGNEKLIALGPSPAVQDDGLLYIY